MWLRGLNIPLSAKFPFTSVREIFSDWLRPKRFFHSDNGRSSDGASRPSYSLSGPVPTLCFTLSRGADVDAQQLPRAQVWLTACLAADCIRHCYRISDFRLCVTELDLNSGLIVRDETEERHGTQCPRRGSAASACPH